MADGQGRVRLGHCVEQNHIRRNDQLDDVNITPSKQAHSHPNQTEGAASHKLELELLFDDKCPKLEDSVNWQRESGYDVEETPSEASFDTSDLDRDPFSFSDEDDDDDDMFSSDNSEFDLDFYLHPFDPTLDSGRTVRPVNPPPPYPHNPVEELECWICFDNKKLRKRICCNFPVCDECIEMYLITQVNQGIVKIECLKTECNSYVHRDEILARLPAELKDKYYKFLVDANKDPHVKTCPRCSHVLTLTGYNQRLNTHILKLKVLKKDKNAISKEDKKLSKDGIKVECPKCELEWCFPCQAPWHEGVTCKQYRKGDRLVKTWANEYHYGQQNAQKCPKCKIFIERTTGCDHMTCSQCRTNFCYRCGDRYWGVKLLGDHFSRYSPFGCKYNFMPDRPGARRFIRGAVLSGKLLGGLVLAGLAVAAGVSLLGLSVVALPAIGGYRYHKRRKRRRMQRYFHSRIRQLDRISYMPNNEGPLEVLDESEDGNQMIPEWLMLGYQLPDSRQVEVLVHRPINSNSDGEEQAHRSEVTQAEEIGHDGAVVTVTDVKEVREEGGYTRVIAHIVTKKAREDNSVPEESDESDSSSDLKPADKRKEEQEFNFSSEEKLSKSESKTQETKTASQDAESKPTTKTGSNRKEDRRNSNSEVELDVKESNGCFANIFSKKLNSLQHTAHDLQQGKFQSNQKGSVKSKSGTWEKGKKKEIGIDIKSLSTLMTNQCSDSCGKVRDEQSSTGDSVQVDSCMCEEVEFCDKCHSAPQGHPYPCDIVTYL